MRKEIVYCDKCGIEINGAFWYADLIKGTEVLVGSHDFCPDCMEKFLEAEPAPDPEPKPKKKQTNKVDRGKVWALKDAGWKVVDIAGEMKCSDATVYNILNAGRPVTES